MHHAEAKSGEKRGDGPKYATIAPDTRVRWADIGRFTMQNSEKITNMTTAERLEYRPMRERDIGAFYDVRFSVTENRIHPHQVHLLNRSLLIEKIRQGGGWICECNDEVAGVCLPVITDTPFISALFVKPIFHGMGVGRELLERAVKWLRDNGVDRVTLVTDPGSRADGFYQHLGWQHGALDEYGCQVVFSKSLEE